MNTKKMNTKGEVAPLYLVGHDKPVAWIAAAIDILQAGLSS